MSIAQTHSINRHILGQVLKVRTSVHMTKQGGATISGSFTEVLAANSHPVTDIQVAIQVIAKLICLQM